MGTDSMTLMAAVGHVLGVPYLWLKRPCLWRFFAAACRPRQVQHRVLLEKVRRHAESDFGRVHGFHTIRGADDFRRQVPITDYEYYRPYVERVMRGDADAMFGRGTRVLMFAVTSGTTNLPKHIPVTAEFFREYRRGWNLWGLGLFRDHPAMLDLQALQLSSDWQDHRTEAGIPCGSISGLAAETRPMIARIGFFLPPAVNRIPCPLSKRYVTLRIALARPRVGMVVTANPLTLLELVRLGNAESESLIRDVHDGTLCRRYEIPAEAATRLDRRLRRKDRRRARELEAIVERTGHLYPRDYWPRLVLLAVWTGGSVGAFCSRLGKYFGTVPLRDHGLSASEGRMTIPFGDNTCAGVLDISASYFEFIPEQEHGKPAPTVLEAHELEEGKDYFILMTTSSGLYRYDIQDVVRCAGFEGSTPALEFLHKAAHYANVTGEKLSEFQVVSAVKQAFQEAKLPLECFTVAPRVDDPPGYVLLTECGTDGRGDRLVRRVDQLLCEANCEYANRLATGRLRKMELRRLRPGIWAAFRQRRIAERGASTEQYKHPCLTGDPGFIEQLPTAPVPHLLADADIDHLLPTTRHSPHV